MKRFALAALAVALLLSISGCKYSQGIQVLDRISIVQDGGTGPGQTISFAIPAKDGSPLLYSFHMDSSEALRGMLVAKGEERQVAVHDLQMKDEACVSVVIGGVRYYVGK